MNTRDTIFLHFLNQTFPHAHHHIGGKFQSFWRNGGKELWNLWKPSELGEEPLILCPCGWQLGCPRTKSLSVIQSCSCSHSLRISAPTATPRGWGGGRRGLPLQTPTGTVSTGLPSWVLWEGAAQSCSPTPPSTPEACPFDIPRVAGEHTQPQHKC